MGFGFGSFVPAILFVLAALCPISAESDELRITPLNRFSTTPETYTALGNSLRRGKKICLGSEGGVIGHILKVDRRHNKVLWTRLSLAGLRGRERRRMRAKIEASKESCREKRSHLAQQSIPDPTPTSPTDASPSPIPTETPGDDSPPTPNATATATSTPTPTPSSTPGGTACSDGIDNDLDGWIDFPNDPDCLNAAQDSEELGGVMTYYLDSVNGNDSFNGSSPSFAFRTLTKAVSVMNAATGTALRFHMAPGDYGAFADSISPRTAWSQFIGAPGEIDALQTGIHYFRQIKQVPTDLYLMLVNLRVTELGQGQSGDWNAVNIKGINHFRLLHSNLTVGGPYANTFERIPTGIGTRSVNNIDAIGNKVTGGRYGFNVNGNNFRIINNEISHQFGDTMRIVGADGVLIQGNLLHSVSDRNCTGEHIDVIQFFASGPACANPQPKNIQIINNKIYNAQGQMIFVQSNWTHCLGPVENVVIRGNILGPKPIDSVAVPIQIQGVLGFELSHNTIHDNVVIRASSDYLFESQGTIRDNIIGSLAVSDSSIIDDLDFNVLGRFTQADTPSLTFGANNIVSPVSFADSQAQNVTPIADRVCGQGPADISEGDFSPVTELACDASSDASYAGAEACLPIEPIARFGILPTVVQIGESAVLDARASLPSNALIEWDDDTGSYATGDRERIFAPNEVGAYRLKLKVTDSSGDFSIREKFLEVHPPPDSSLVTFLPLDQNASNFANSFRAVNWFDTEPVFIAGPRRFGARVSANQALGLDRANEIAGREALTIAFWAMKDQASATGYLVSAHTTILGQYTSSGLAFSVTTLDANGVTQSAQITSSQQIDGGIWHHFALTYDGSQIKLFMDGQLIGTPQALTGPIRVNAGNWPIRFGRAAVSSSGIFDGAIDDVRIYSRALSQEEIGNLSQQ